MQLKILIVEDSATQAEHLRYILEEHGYQIAVARDGKQALVQLGPFQPALVLSDIIMPEMDGYQLCRAIKQDPQLQNIPVILLTSLGDPEDVIRGLESGADSFVVKPYDEDYLVSRIEFVIANRSAHIPDDSAGSVQLAFAGQSFNIHADRSQILNLLLSTYEAAVQRNLELARARDEARELNARVTRLQRITAALSEAVTAQQVEEIMVKQSVAAFGAEGGMLGLLDESGATIEIARGWGYSSEEMTPWQHLPLSTQVPMADAVRTGQPVWNESLKEIRDKCREAGLSSRDENESFTAVPLIAKGRTIGAIVLGFKEPHEFDANDQALALSLGQQCAQALERASLYESERRARETAEEAIHHRDEFIAIASHELKTPLTTIKGYSELLVQRGKESELTEQHLRMARSILQQSGRLEKMISLLLDISRLEKGQLALEWQQVDLNKLIRSVIDELEPTLRQHRLELASYDGELFVTGDELRLEQVLQNLVQNAIKYSPLGGLIRVELRKEDRMACISVSDQGIGIPKEEMQRLFTRCYRASNATTFHISGFGVGLYVVREIVRLHGGDISVESQETQGTTFAIRLPLERTGQETACQKPDISRPEIRQVQESGRRQLTKPRVSCFISGVFAHPAI